MTADPRARWAEQLATSAESTSDEAVAAFLRTLPKGNFLPAPEQVAAVNALAAAALPVGPDYTVEQLLRNEVETFAAQYWALAPTERRAAWEDLSRRGANVARLRELEQGLHLLVTPLADPIAEELAALMRELFVLPPRERSIRRNTWLFVRTAEETKWREAFAAVHREVPALATLDSQLAVALSPTHAEAALAQANSARQSALRARDDIKDGFDDFGRRMREYQQTAKPAASSSGQSRATASFGAFGVLGVVIVLFKILGAIGSSGSTSPKYTPPVIPPNINYSAPAPDQGDQLKEGPFSPEEVEKFEQYERDEAAGMARHRSTRYAVWKMSKLQREVESLLAETVFSSADIQECREYERTMNGRKPILYERWLKFGKPTEPGKYSFRPPKP